VRRKGGNRKPPKNVFATRTVTVEEHRPLGYLCTKEISQITGIRYDILREAIYKSGITFFKFGGVLFVHKDNVTKLLKERLQYRFPEALQRWQRAMQEGQLRSVG